MHISVTFPPDASLTERRFGGYPAPDAVCEVRRSASAVDVEFVLLDCSNQQSGHFSVSPDVARWLAGALLAAADGHTDRFPLSVSITHDSINRNAS